MNPFTVSIFRAMSSYTYEEEFKKADFNSTPLAKGEYEACTFENCRLNEADLTEMKFIECSFIECDLSNAKVSKSLFQEVKSWKEAKSHQGSHFGIK